MNPGGQLRGLWLASDDQASPGWKRGYLIAQIFEICCESGYN